MIKMQNIPEPPKEFKIAPKPLDADAGFLAFRHEIKDSYNEKMNKLFSDIHDQHKFWLKTGESLKNLRELYDSLAMISDATFHHHVTPERNDFSNWVRDAIKDDKLAIDLLYANNREDARRVIEKRIRELSEGSKQMDDFAESEHMFVKWFKKKKEENTQLEGMLDKKRQWLFEKQKELEEKEKRIRENEQQLMARDLELQKQEKGLQTNIREHEYRMMQEKRELEEKAKKIIFMSPVKPLNEKNPYEELDYLIRQVTKDVQEKKFNEAKDLLPKIKYFYDNIDPYDHKKREYYYEILEMKRVLESKTPA